MNTTATKIGIIGTGWVGGTYARLFESQGYNPICYSLDPKYIHNKDAIQDCDFVMIAVPTPTTHAGFDASNLKDVLKLVGKNKIAFIKSTIVPGTTDMLQKENPDVLVIHSPEFLSMATADQDAAYPKRNIIGLPVMNETYQNAAKLIEAIMPKAPYTTICSAVDAEIIKYTHNAGGYLRIVFHNILFDICQKTGGNWDEVKNAIAADATNVLSYLNPVHDKGRGAGGPCFIKDFYAFTKFYETLGDRAGTAMLNAVETKNIQLLEQTGKDLNILYSVHPELQKSMAA